MYEIMLKSKRYVYVAFTCEQAIEKLVKALHVLYTGNEAPKSHNIYTYLNWYLKIMITIIK